VIYIKECSKTALNTAKDNKHLQMEIFMRDPLSMGRLMDLENISGTMVVSTKEI
jgi:hypothetical protein